MGLDIGQLSPWVVGAYLVPLLAVLAWIVVGAFKDGELPMMPGLLAIMLMGFGMFAVYEPKPDEWETFKAAPPAGRGHITYGQATKPASSARTVMASASPSWGASGWWPPGSRT